MHQTQLFWADWRQSDVIAELSFLEHESSPAVLLRFAWYIPVPGFAFSARLMLEPGFTTSNMKRSPKPRRISIRLGGTSVARREVGIASWGVPADHEFLATVDSHLPPDARPLAWLIAAVAAFRNQPFHPCCAR